jgi:hypothetical protein
MRRAVEYAAMDWERLGLRKGFWQSGIGPAAMLKMTPSEFRYVCLSVQRESVDFYDRVLDSVVFNNTRRGERGELPRIPTNLKTQMEAGHAGRPVGDQCPDQP